MSSPTYSTDLKPDLQQRRLVLLAGILAAVTGSIIILFTPLALHWRLLCVAIWGASSVRDVVVLRRGQQRFDCIRLRQDGSVLLRGRDTCWFPATLAPGSVVLQQIAWLRFEADDGRKYAELLRRNSSQSEPWRRLQVIWRHLGAGT